MPYRPPHRNLDGVQFDKIRKNIDTTFNEIHDQLTECYYDFWKEGNSKPFIVAGKSYDVQATPEESKILFDKLHGLLFEIYHTKFHAENRKLPAGEQYDEAKYNNIRNEDGSSTSRDVEAIKKIAQLRKEGIIIDM